MGAHSIIPPSSAGIWGAPFGCTAWPTMAQAYPETEQTPEAAEGDAAHELGAIQIQGRLNIPREIAVGTEAPNGLIWDDEMFDAAEVYASDVLAIMMTTPEGAIGDVEAKVKAHSTVHPLSEGTTDAYLYSTALSTLYIWDFKYGHSLVEAFENWQGINYAAGLFEKFNLPAGTKIQIRIVQPRGFHREGTIRVWETNIDYLRANQFPQLKRSAEKALSGHAEANSGPHCRYCPGRHGCEAALKGGVQLYEAASRPTPVELTPHALGVQLAIVQRARKQLEYLEDGFKEQAKSLIRSGEVVPHWGMLPGPTRETWAVSDAEVITAGDLVRVDIRQAAKAMTPKQAREAGMLSDVVAAYSKRTKAGLILTLDDGTQARKVFAS